MWEASKAAKYSNKLRIYHANHFIMKKYGKKYQDAQKHVSSELVKNLEEAVKLVKATATTKFDSTAELHVNLNIDPKKADQMVRSTILLPHGTGKKLKIAAVVSDEKVKAAKEAGAAAAGLEDLIEEFKKGKFDYDVVVATPDVMKHLGKVAKTLGQKGIMPNPKSGTVTDDINKTIEELNRGKVEVRNDKNGIVHCIFGKASFKEAELENNLKSLLVAIRDAKPSGAKGTYVKSITVTTSMGPGIKLDPSEIMGNLSK